MLNIGGVLSAEYWLVNQLVYDRIFYNCTLQSSYKQVVLHPYNPNARTYMIHPIEEKTIQIHVGM